MKTYEQLMQHYWGKIVPMAEAAGVNPWKCVKISNISITLCTYHPDFSFSPDRYTFAITVLEGRPVFIGDTLYTKTGLPFTVTKGDLVGESSAWTPPTKKRTFMLGDKELPCPAKRPPMNSHSLAIELKHTDDWVIQKHMFWFDDNDNAYLVNESLAKFLTEARDKE